MAYQHFVLSTIKAPRAMHAPLIPSLDLARKTLAADVSYTISRMQVLERIPGNPLDIAYRRIDDTVVALAARLPSFCRVIGLEAAHAHHIAPLVGWYRDRGVAPTFEMVPGLYDQSLGGELARLGFYQSGFHASLIGTPADGVPEASGIEVEAVRSGDTMEEFLAAYVAGWEFPARHREQFKANVRPWRELPGWSLYLARVNGRAAAAATLYLHDRVAYLADGTTDPAFRGRGLHMALLLRRMRDAAAKGAEIIFSGAAPFSTSHRNMERAGLRLQFVRSKWTPAT